MYVFQKGKIKFSVQEDERLGNFIEYEENETMLAMSSKQKIDFMYCQIKNLNLNLGKDLSCKKVYMKYINSVNKEV